MQQIKNIIFDLGGVLINIDYHKTSEAFINMGFDNFDELYSQFKANDLFENLETGKVSEMDFYAAMLQHDSKGMLQPKDIEKAWNAMLLDFRMESLLFLNNLKGRYNLFLLSNTNSIHRTAFQQIFANQVGKSVFLEDYFTKSYYSHVVGLRKPYQGIYQFVLNDGNMKAEETLFIDDSINNIEGAMALGIKTHHLKNDEKIELLNFE